MKHNQRFRSLIWVLVATTLVGISFWLVVRGNQNATKCKSTQAARYEILNDEMGTIISIGVEADINEEQLRATLAKAANEHQDDAARDYLTSEYLWVEAYLLRQGQQSSTTAGKLRRYVPPGNPAVRRKMTIDRGKGDSFTITLDEARRTLQ